MSQAGWVKLHRALLENPIWKQSTPEQKTILITLLLMANHKQAQWEWGCKKFYTEPGQLITSIDSIKKAAGKDISHRNVRTALVRFEKLGFLTNQSTKYGRIITIVNWDTYQHPETQPDKQTDKGVTKDRQRGDKGLTPNKKLRREECKKEDPPLFNSPPKKSKPKFDPLSYLRSQGVSDQVAEDWIAHRRTKRANTTKTSIDMIAKQAKLADLSLEAALAESIANGWQGFKAEWYFKRRESGGKQKFITTQTGKVVDAELAAFIERNVLGKEECDEPVSQSSRRGTRKDGKCLPSKTG